MAGLVYSSRSSPESTNLSCLHPRAIKPRQGGRIDVHQKLNYVRFQDIMASCPSKSRYDG